VQTRAVKIGGNPQSNQAHHEFGLGWNFFTNFNTGWFLTRLIKNSVQPGWTHGESDWLTNPQIKGHTSIFC